MSRTVPSREDETEIPGTSRPGVPATFAGTHPTSRSSGSGVPGPDLPIPMFGTVVFREFMGMNSRASEATNSFTAARPRRVFTAFPFARFFSRAGMSAARGQRQDSKLWDEFKRGD